MARRAHSKVTPARALALDLTREARQRDAYIRELIDTRRESSLLEPEEFAYAQVLAFGVTMCMGTLDEAIDRSLNSPRDIKPKVRDALRISAYELLFLHKPDHVVADQGVELVRSLAPRAAGLANAVLRKMIADAKAFPWGDPSTDERAFARMYGIGTWLAKRLVSQYGAKRAGQVLEASLSAAPTYLRANPFCAEKPFASDLSAQLVASLVSLDAPVLEIGAGRGTKTMLIESRARETLGRTIPIHAVDLHEYRAKLLQERMRVFCIEDVLAFAGDARELDAVDGLLGEYPSVFLDVPCSGTGTLRRHPEIRWRLRPEDVSELASLQLAMLLEAARRVAPGGRLVYATCSILKEENADVIDAFLESELGSGFSIVPIEGLSIPQGSMLGSGEPVASLPNNWEIGKRGFFASLPAGNAPDGHFAAVLQRMR